MDDQGEGDGAGPGAIAAELGKWRPKRTTFVERGGGEPSSSTSRQEKQASRSSDGAAVKICAATDGASELGSRSGT